MPILKATNGAEFRIPEGATLIFSEAPAKRGIFYFTDFGSKEKPPRVLGSVDLSSRGLKFEFFATLQASEYAMTRSSLSSKEFEVLASTPVGQEIDPVKYAEMPQLSYAVRQVGEAYEGMRVAMAEADGTLTPFRRR